MPGRSPRSDELHAIARELAQLARRLDAVGCPGKAAEIRQLVAAVEWEAQPAAR